MNNAKSISELSDIELREAVAVEVVGWRLDDGDWLLDNPHSGTNGGIEMPCYELDIGAAFEMQSHAIESERNTEYEGYYCEALVQLLREDLGAKRRGQQVNSTSIFEVALRERLIAATPRERCIAALTAVRARKA